ncbi:GTP diphosphokinase [Candidatus Regiella insecticola]|uniref:GTP pyrophosphokinase n=1 Tax=Candidatus Regiella insecticola TaxID=138073 RepID=A0A6L2ZL10_9ENTR|nr:GTP diphosphokinase [Candidatus Regiella insecticola]GFN45272.1 GTP diphosphokinase [Candidatus Regiella insecticola]
MVAIRRTHLNSTGEFSLDTWIANLGLSNLHSSKKLAETWHYCEQQTKNYPEASLLLWRGLEMVEILATLSMDNDSLCAALLFPLVNANLLEEKNLSEKHGKDIAALIRGVRDMDAIRQLRAVHNDATNANQVDNVRRMLLAMVEDFRCVVIKLAERITQLREVKNAPEEERLLVAKECSNIYAPLANRLGIGQMKWELEDLSFRYLHPTEYQKIAKLLHERRIDREQFITNFATTLRKAMADEDIKAEICGRPKHLYSIWRKMQKKSLTFDELFDVRAVRIVVERLQDCYAALGVVHTHFRHLPDEFEDYVANPKPNGYQSIHSVVLGPGGKTLEVQIRTNQMHENAELGIAAHWKYKEGTTAGRAGYDSRIAWLRKLISWQEEMADSGAILDEVRSQVFDDRVYVFTPKGDVIDLPVYSTPLDFAYYIHSDVGHRCIGAKVGERIVPFTYQLKMGDRIEIITQKHPNPSRDWLNPNLGYITSHRARAKIHNWFRKQDREKNILAGRQIIDNELAQLDISLKEAEKWLIPRYNVNSLDEVLMAMGAGDIRINQMVNFLRGKYNKPSPEEADKQAMQYLTDRTQQGAVNSKEPGRIIVGGVGNLMYSIAHCCYPIPGDNIVGFITKGRGISIHQAHCEQLTELRLHVPERIVDVAWSENYSSEYSLLVRVTAHDRSGLLRDITSVLANEKVKVLKLASHSDAKKKLATIDIDIVIASATAQQRVLAKLKALAEVIDAERFPLH